jgi:hypothetical protein
MQLNFGAGDLFASLIRDASGAAIAVPTPVRIAGLQEMSLEFSGDIKEFHGQQRFPLAVAQGKVKVGGKFKGAIIAGQHLNTLFFGSGLTSGTMRSIVAPTTLVAIPATPFQITPTIPNSGTWTEDLGVVDNLGLTMTRVASGPAAGQYSVAAGVYTFASADNVAGKTVAISFAYTFTQAAARRIQLQNLAMGETPAIKINYRNRFQGRDCVVVLESVISSKLALLAAKNDDYSVPEIDFSAQADASGLTVGDIYMAE